MYADYTYYSNEWAGTKIPASDFTEYARKAERLIKYITNNRITEVTDEVKNAVCAAAEAAYDIRQSVANVPQGIKSENTDGYSVTFKDADEETLLAKEQSAMLVVIEQELSTTGLLYRGV